MRHIHRVGMVTGAVSFNRLVPYVGIVAVSLTVALLLVLYRRARRGKMGRAETDGGTV